METQISGLNNPLPSLGEILGKWFGLGGSWLKTLLIMLFTPPGNFNYSLSNL